MATSIVSAPHERVYSQIHLLGISPGLDEWNDLETQNCILETLERFTEVIGEHAKVKGEASIRTIADFEELAAFFHRTKTAKQAQACQDCPCTNVHGKFS